MVRGSDSGKNVTSTVVYHDHEEARADPMVGFGTSPKENPPDRGGSSANEFNFPDVAMMEDLDQFDPSAGVADGHMRS